jgi:hypothetical protein
MKNKILFHVGLHKTATSSLQKDFFIPKYNFVQHQKGRGSWLPIFVNKFSTELTDSSEKEKVHNFVVSAIGDGLVPVVSHERLSGYPLSGGYDRLSIYRRIASLDLDVKILFVIREQKDWLYSAWRQMISDGGSISLHNFLQQKSLAPNVRVPSPRHEYLNYYLEIKTLYSLFGKANVLIVPFEEINHDFPSFCEKLATFIDLDSGGDWPKTLPHRNQRQKLSQFYFKRVVNRFLFSSPTSPCGLLPQTRISSGARALLYKSASLLPEIPLSQRIIQHHKKVISKHIGDYFVESNALAAAELGIDLGGWGYDI